MKNLFLDLDGTLLDIWPRYYAITSHFLQKYNYTPPLLNQYIKMKKRVEKDDIILSLLGVESNHINLYKKFKRDHLETQGYLAYDRVIGDFALFRQACPEYRCILITMRNNRNNLYWQLNQLDLNQYLDDVICVQGDKFTNTKTLALSSIAKEGDFIIGDSNIDIECGLALNMHCFFVQSGLFDKSKIKKLRGDSMVMILRDYQDFIDRGH